jgi:hypothetical protein
MTVAWTRPDRRPIQHDLGALDVKIRSHGSADWGLASGGALYRKPDRREQRDHPVFSMLLLQPPSDNLLRDSMIQ